MRATRIALKKNPYLCLGTVMVQLHLEPSDNSGWGGSQEVSNPTSCSKQRQLSDRTISPGAVPTCFLENSKVGNSTAFPGPQTYVQEMVIMLLGKLFISLLHFIALVASECAKATEQSGSSCTISCHKVPGDQRSSCFSVWALDDLSMFKVNSPSEHPSMSFYSTAFMVASVWTSLFQ